MLLNCHDDYFFYLQYIHLFVGLASESSNMENDIAMDRSIKKAYFVGHAGRLKMTSDEPVTKLWRPPKLCSHGQTDEALSLLLF
jgi:hypothetical protein